MKLTIYLFFCLFAYCSAWGRGDLEKYGPFQVALHSKLIKYHSEYTNDKQGYLHSYERSVKYVYYIGKALANFLVGLAEGGISPKNMHCIGHSLGSQMLGQTGQIFFEKTGTKIARITGLDPAGPCFSNSFIEDQIRSGVADFVDIYHCNAGGLGTTSVLGEHNKDLNLDVSGIDVYFYDFLRNDVETFTIDNAARGILSIPELIKVKQFIIFVPGYKSNINKKTEELIRDTFRNYPNSYLIIIDHSEYTNDKQGYLHSYERSVKYVYYIGKALANFLVGLAEGGISPKNMHCIGHSLGSQMLGQTGQIFFEKAGTKIARITGLDPAGPCFSNSFIEDQIRSGVADFVDIYHCNAGGLGTTSVLGDIDFFANKKGQSQPKCGTPLIPGVFDSSKAAKCNHRACIEYYAATVSNPNWFLAWKCDEYKMFKNGQCSRNDVTIAGFWNPGNATGVYYFSTDAYNID